MAKPKILLVDDTRLVLELEKSFLKLSDVEVLTAGNGVEALALIRKDPPDLVFMDMNMPEMDGISCCTLIKSDPFLSDIPVVMLTTAGREVTGSGPSGGVQRLHDQADRPPRVPGDGPQVHRGGGPAGARIPCHFPVLFLQGKSPVSAHALDLSDGGLFLATHEPVRQDAAEARPLPSRGRPV